MDYAGKTVKDPSCIDDSQMKNVLAELNTWCMNYRGFINQVFSEQVTMEEKVTKLFWVVKKVAESQLDVTESYNDLYQFVINYFDSHDFQTMVNNKLDQMAQDGTLESLINDRILGGIKNDISSVSARVSTLERDMSNQKVLVGKLTGWSLSGKQIDWFGDSIIYGEMPGGNRAKKPIPQLFAEATGANCVNHAVSGSTISDNEWSAKVINQVNDADLSNSDYVIIEGGINDYFLNYPVGTITLTGSFSEGLYKILNTIASKNQFVKIIVLTMFPNNALFNGSLGHDGANFINYNDAIKQICMDRGIRCIDMTYNAINKASFSTFSSDGTHFNQNGYNMLTKALINGIYTATTILPIRSGNNLADGLFATADISSTDETNANIALTGNTILLNSSNKKVYSVVAMRMVKGAYTVRFKCRIKGGKATIYFGCETYEQLGAIVDVPGDDRIIFREYEITVNPTSFNNRVLFKLSDDSTCTYALITDVTICEGNVPCKGDSMIDNRANVSLNAAYFNSTYPLQFKQRNRFISFNGPVQTKAVVPANTNLVSLSNYNLGYGRYKPSNCVIFATDLSGNVYPLMLNFDSSLNIVNLKQIPTNTNLGITAVVDIS